MEEIIDIPQELYSALKAFDFTKFEEDDQFDGFLMKRYGVTKEDVVEFRSAFFFKLAAELHRDKKNT